MKNVMNLLKENERFLGTKRPILKDLTLEITKKCPMECLICSSNSCESCNVEFRFSELKRIVNDAIELGCESIALSGGEPMIYPKIIELCEYLKKKKVETIIYTCGNITSNGTIQAIPENALDQLKEIGVDKIIFSIHGSKEEHEKITTKKGSFKNLLTSVDRAKNLGFNTEFHFVPTKRNYKSLQTIVSIAEKMGVPTVSLLRFVPQGRGKLNRKSLELSYNETLELKSLIESLRAKSKVRIRVGAHYSCLGLNGARCTAAWEKATILPEGFVVPCPSMKELWRRDYLDDVKKRSLSDIWYNSQIFIETRTFFNKILSTPCARYCKNFNVCKGGCPTQRILFYGGVERGPDPLCSNKSIWISTNFRLQKVPVLLSNVTTCRANFMGGLVVEHSLRF